MQESEAARDFNKVMEHVAAGDEVLLERDGMEFAIVIATREPNSRFLTAGRSQSIQEVVAALEEEERQSGPVFIDEKYAHDLASAHAFWNEPLDASAWD